jgi:hypothetical protein
MQWPLTSQLHGSFLKENIFFHFVSSSTHLCQCLQNICTEGQLLSDPFDSEGNKYYECERKMSTGRLFLEQKSCGDNKFFNGKECQQLGAFAAFKMALRTF